MKIAIKNGDELQKLVTKLAQEIVQARNYYRLFDAIMVAFPSYEEEFHQANTFWNLTVNALDEAGFVCLCRVYDQESSALSLVNLLDTLKAKPGLLNRVPDMNEIEQDIEFASCANPLVEKLMHWRNNTVAHRGAKITLGKDRILVDNPLPPERIQELLDGALSIFNKYSSLCQNSAWSAGLIGHDDYKNLLNLVRLGIKKWDQESGYQAEPTTRLRVEEEREVDNHTETLELWKKVAVSVAAWEVAVAKEMTARQVGTEAVETVKRKKRAEGLGVGVANASRPPTADTTAATQVVAAVQKEVEKAMKAAVKQREQESEEAMKRMREAIEAAQKAIVGVRE